MDTLGVARAAAEDQIKLGEIEVFNGEGVEHEVLPKAPLHSRQVLHGRRANVSATQFFREAVRQRHGCIHRGGGKRFVHGRSHALSSTHLNEVVVYEGNL